MATTKTDKQGKYIFKDVILEENSRLVLGFNIDDQRFSSDVFIYDGKKDDFSFNFKLPIKLSSLEKHIINISGKIIGNLSSNSVDSPKINLEKFILNADGTLTNKEVTSVEIKNGAYQFKNIEVEKQAAFKIYIKYFEQKLTSNLFFARSNSLVQDLQIPNIAHNNDLLNIKRETIVVDLSNDGYRLAHFISIENKSNDIVLLDKTPITKILPKNSFEVKSNLLEINQARLDNNNLVIDGAVLPGENIIFLEYSVKSDFLNTKIPLNFIKSTASSDIVFRPSEVNVAGPDLQTEVAISVGQFKDYVSKAVNLVNLGEASMIITLSSKWLSDYYYYLLAIVFSIPLFLALIIYYFKNKANKLS